MSTLKAVPLLMGALLISQCSAPAKVPRKPTSEAKWEKIFLPIVERVSSASKIISLRDKPLHPDDLEVRIWRGFGLSPLEGLILTRSETDSSAMHILGNDPVVVTATSTTHLSEPKSGWTAFWEKLIDLGLFRLSDPETGPCTDYMVDGTSHVVEISNGGVYRTYLYQSDLKNCENATVMDKISIFLGEEFHDGRSECKAAEWLPCAEVLRRRSEKDGKVF